MKPTVINDKWVMTWSKGQYVCSREMKLFEMIRYFIRILLRKMIFPEIRRDV